MLSPRWMRAMVLLLALGSCRCRGDLGPHMEAMMHDKGWYGGGSGGLGEAAELGMGGRQLLFDQWLPQHGPTAREPLNSEMPQNPTYAAYHFKVPDGADHDHGVADKQGGKSARCLHTVGEWCEGFLNQEPIPTKAAPRGNKECKNNCNGVGNCHYDLGQCQCPAGWTGDDCTTPEKRPCSNRLRPEKNPGTEVTNHTDADGRDLDWLNPGWLASRCAGICDDNLAMCWCDGQNEKYRFIPAPKGSPPGTPPIQRGRPLSEYCGKVQQDKDGKTVQWGNVPYSRVYGPTGWCEADRVPVENRCDCQVDDLDGDQCEDVKEAYCPNQCSGHGECSLGFCKCHQDWYGLDCSRKRAGKQMEPGDSENGRKPWLTKPGLGSLPPAARDPPASPTRKRPLIYVYDSPPPYTGRMLQYRLVWKSCIWRRFKTRHNESALHDWLYGVETYFHEAMLNSPHRTFDPEEADFFYVPLYLTCYFWPIIGWSDHPWWGGPKAVPRPMHGAHMMRDLKNWLKDSFPYWNRRGGRDHIWLVAADEGACWMPTEIYNTSIVLTHWGRMDKQHTSATGYFLDNYNIEYQDPTFQPNDWREIYAGHPCYDPKKDLVIPSLKLPSHYTASPLLGSEPLRRDILLFFRGDVGSNRDKGYSRGIRQQLYKLSVDGWRKEHQIYILKGDEMLHLSYSTMLARSTFCLVAPGDGWSARAEDSILHGCLPLIIMDNVHGVLESILDWDSFSVRVSQKDIELIPTILKSIPPEKIVRMQQRLSQVWHRFAYAQGQLIQNDIEERINNAFNHIADGSMGLSPLYPLQRVKSFPVEDDAFSTIISWLHSRIPYTLGKE